MNLGHSRADRLRKLINISSRLVTAPKIKICPSFNTTFTNGGICLDGSSTNSTASIKKNAQKQQTTSEHVRNFCVLFGVNRNLSNIETHHPPAHLINYSFVSLSFIHSIKNSTSYFARHSRTSSKRIVSSQFFVPRYFRSSFFVAKLSPSTVRRMSSFCNPFSSANDSGMTRLTR